MSVNGINDQELKTAADYQQLADDIESLMAAPAGVDAVSVIRLQSRFEQAARSINARLRECDQLLKKGLRNEALERCHAEPALLELFLILDFPERESWNETVKQCGLTPSELLVSVAGELNDAIIAEKPLAELKYQVRLHALARSPLPIRILLMRKLAKVDPSTAVWEEDLRNFEHVRHTQLSGEIQAAIESENLTALNELHDELHHPDWRIPPSHRKLKQVTDAIGNLRKRDALERLSRLEPDLLAAFAAFDIPRGRELRDSWRRNVDEAALPASHPLMQRVAPALQWLWDQDQQEQEQSAYDRAVAELVQALDKGAGRLLLEEKYHSLMALGRGIPDDIRQRLEERLRRLDRERTRGLQLRIAAVAAVVCLLAGFGVYAIRQANFQNQIREQVAVVQKMLDEKQLAEADAYLLKLDVEAPLVARSPEVEQVRSELKLAQEKDATRHVDFDSLLASARRDGTDERSTLKTIPSAQASLSKAWDLAVYSSEKAQVKDLSKSVEERQSALQKMTDEQFTADVTGKKSEFQRLKSAPMDNLSQLKSLRDETKTLLEREGVSAELRDSSGQSLVAELDQAIQQGTKFQSEARFLKEINAVIGERAKFFSQLERYADSPEFVGTSRANDFLRVAKSEAALVTGYQSWSAFLEGIMRRDLTALDATTASRLRAEGEKLIKDHPGFPYGPQIQPALGYLGKSAARERGSPVMEQLLALKVFKLLAVRSESKRFYLAAEPPSKDSRGGQMIKFYTDTEFKTTKQERLVNVENEPGYRSPQMLFESEAGGMLGKLRDQKGMNWDATFIELLGKLYNAPGMDPILKIQLIPHVLHAAGEGSDFLPRRLEKIAADIDREKLNPSANWVLPDDQEANQVRIRADILLKRMAGELHDVKPLLMESEAAQQSLKRPRFDIHFAWTAWLQRDHDNKWTCTFRGNTPLNPLGGDLYILQRSASGEVGFVRIGQQQQGQVTIDANAQDLLEGRPVFEKKLDQPAQ